MNAAAVSSWVGDAEDFLAVLAGSWLIESTVVLVIGLLAAKALQRQGAALVSVILRATLVGVLLCPVASFASRAAGVAGVRLALPETSAELPSETSFPAPPADRPREAAPLAESAFRMDEPGTDGEALAVAGDRLAAPVEASSADRPEAIATVPASDDTAANPLPRSAEVERPQAAWLRRELAIAFVWVAGSLLLIARLAVANLILLRVRRRAVPADPQVASACRLLAERLDVRTPDVLVSGWVAGPCLVGCRHSVILLPAAPADGDRAVLIHELAHLKRRDCLWQLVGQAAAALLWFQPLLWRLVRQVEQSADHVCDDYALELGSGRESYARRLVALAESHEAGWAETAAAVGIVRFRSSLGQRVQRIVDDARRLSLRVRGRIVLSVLLLAGACVLTAGLIGIGRGPEATADELALVANLKSEGDEKDRGASLSIKPRDEVVQNEPRKAPATTGLTGEFLLSDGTTVKGKLLPSPTAVIRWLPEGSDATKLLRLEEFAAIRLPRPENPPRPAGNVCVDFADGNVVYGMLRGVNPDAIEINIAGVEQKLDRGRIDAIYFRLTPDAAALGLPGLMDWKVSDPMTRTLITLPRPAGQVTTEGPGAKEYAAWREAKEQQIKEMRDPFGVLSGTPPPVSPARPIAGNEKSQGADKSARAASQPAPDPNPEATKALIASIGQPLKERFEHAWHDEGGSLVTDLPKSEAYRDFALPERMAIELELSWNRKPDFCLAVGVNGDIRSTHSAFRLETWDRDVVILRETEREADVGTVQTLAGSTRLNVQLLIDQVQGRISVVDRAGRRLTDLKIASGDTRIQPGIRLVNKSGDPRLERLRILPWNGKDLPGLAPTRLHLRDGSIVPGTPVGYDPATREVRVSPADGGAERTIPAETIAGIIFPRQPPPPDPDRRGPLVGVMRHDGTRLIGRLMNIDEQALWLRWPATGESTPIALGDIQSIFVRPQ